MSIVSFMAEEGWAYRGPVVTWPAGHQSGCGADSGSGSRSSRDSSPAARRWLVSAGSVVGAVYRGAGGGGMVGGAAGGDLKFAEMRHPRGTFGVGGPP